MLVSSVFNTVDTNCRSNDEWSLNSTDSKKRSTALAKPNIITQYTPKIKTLKPTICFTRNRIIRGALLNTNFQLDVYCIIVDLIMVINKRYSFEEWKGLKVIGLKVSSKNENSTASLRTETRFKEKTDKVGWLPNGHKHTSLHPHGSPSQRFSVGYMRG